jgi:hypothetical protein
VSKVPKPSEELLIYIYIYIQEDIEDHAATHTEKAMEDTKMAENH